MLFALPGIRSNGNDFVDEAVRRGAKVIITEDDKIEIPSSAVKICVEDSRKTLAKYAKRYYGSPDESLDVIGITVRTVKPLFLPLLVIFWKKKVSPLV